MERGNKGEMRYLLRVDPVRHMNRWYSVHVQSTLFDQWAVVCAWGSRRIDSARQRAIPAKNQAQAYQMAEKIVERKIRRGYIERADVIHKG